MGTLPRTPEHDQRAAELPPFPRDGSDADVLRWRELVRQFGSPLFNDLLDWVDQHFAEEEAKDAPAA